MWSKISNALKPRQTHDDVEQPSAVSQGEVMSRVYEQHPNLSVFHSASELPLPPASPPSSPSKHGRLGMFKRTSKTPKDESEARGPSPIKLPMGLSKKVKSTLHVNGNGSQLSLARASSSTARPSEDVARRPSLDVLRPSKNASHPFQESTQSNRPSLDMLRPSQDAPRQSQDVFRSQDAAHSAQEGITNRPMTPNIDPKSGSTRSILRDPKTPGTGQNVRFFSRDAYKVISPDQSMENAYQSVIQSQLPESEAPPTPPLKPQTQRQQDQKPFPERLQRLPSENAGTPAVVTRSASHSKSSRPSIAEVFTPLKDGDDSAATTQRSLSLPNVISPPNFSNIFDTSQCLDLPTVPPGLGFVIDEPVLEGATDLNTTEAADRDGDSEKRRIAMTSTPHNNVGRSKAKEKELETEIDKENQPIDDTIFHAKEKAPRLPSILHERSQSFSFGQTVFYSIANHSADPNSSPTHSPSSDSKLPAAKDGSLSSTSPGTKSRSRALSDTVFQSMLRSSPKPPEADINDESSSDLIVYDNGAAEPDPFRVDANTYYTPQTMIPVTPPKEVVAHNRKPSKEESVIISLQTQLALRSELCGQYETDLRARDELVEILGKKLGDVEKEEAKRRAVLRSWKKKVAELEKTCRYLEEEVEGSRHVSMERSIMDEASGEALRMLHRQIAGLEREKGEWLRKEEVLREQVDCLDRLAKERSEDIVKLKESLEKKDESERVLQEGIREAQEQMEQMGNISFAGVDEDLRKLVIENEQKAEEERARHRATETKWKEENVELGIKLEDLKAEKEIMERELEDVTQKLKTRDEEFALLKGELEAQWGHMEKSSKSIEKLKNERDEIEKDRDVLKGDMEALEERMGTLEMEWTESENRKTELEGEVQELWDEKGALEKERIQLEDELHQERERAVELTHTLHDREARISELDQERQYALDSVSRLEENIRRRDSESSDYSQQVVQREAEAERLREQMADMKREHTRLIDEQNRALRETAGQEVETRMHMEVLVRQKAEADVEIKIMKDRITALKDEVERLRRQVHELQQESADKEVRIVQITKQRSQDKEDLQGLNIALDSKQQELELLKRRLGVRGTAGSTPAQLSKIAHHRRDSSVFATPITSRPPSAMSESGKEGNTLNKDYKSTDTPSATATRLPALGKSSRMNGNAAGSVMTLSSSTKSARGIEGSMGPPPNKPRSSTASTPTPGARVPLYRSSSAKSAAQPSTPIPAAHQRVSSVSLEQSQKKAKLPRHAVGASPAPSNSERNEKENINVDAQNPKRRSLIPTPA